MGTTPGPAVLPPIIPTGAPNGAATGRTGVAGPKGATTFVLEFDGAALRAVPTEVGLYCPPDPCTETGLTACGDAAGGAAT